MKPWLHFALSNKIDLCIVGPDDPLADGIVDVFEKRAADLVPENAAIIESSKVFSKILKKYNIPTAAYETFDQADKCYRVFKNQRFSHCGKGTA